MAPAHVPSAPSDLWREVLTSTQAAVTELIALGMTNAEIAAALFVTTHTVKFHVTDALKASGSRNRVELARWWFENVELREREAHRDGR